MPIISAKVITRARQEKVAAMPDGSYKVWTRAVPERGRANDRVLKLLSEHFGKLVGDIVIVSGEAASKKIIKIK